MVRGTLLAGIRTLRVALPGSLQHLGHHRLEHFMDSGDDRSHPVLAMAHQAVQESETTATVLSHA